MFQPFHCVLPCCLAAALIVCGSVSAPAESPTSFTLANGLHVRLVPEPDPGNMSVLLAVRAGMLQERKGESHLAHITEHATVFDLGDASLVETVNDWFPQNRANAETLGELMYFDLHGKRADLRKALAIDAARLGGMNYSPATLEREIPRALAEVEHLLKVPGGMGKFALIPFAQAALFGQSKVPLYQRTKTIGVEEVRDFHDRCFGVESARLVVVGDFDTAQTRRDIESRFAQLPRGKAPLPPRPALVPGKRRVHWDVSARHWFIAWQIPAVDEADYPALYLAGRLLQERLFNSTDHAASRPLVQTDFERMLVIGCEASNADSFETLPKRIVAETARLSQPGALDDATLRSFCDQLDRFQRTDLGSVPLPAGLTRTMGRTNIELQRLTVEMVAGDFDDFLKKLRTVSPTAARAAIAKWLSADQACIVEVLPEGDG
ncbi:MAG TPA: insulinase family protein [Pirellulales bacterium]|nr:insulinase family protein [Pirellulales bacterium]